MSQEELKQVVITEKELAEPCYFDLGIHEVEIAGVEITKTDNGKFYAEVAVAGSDGRKDKVRLWLHTPDTRRISIDTVRRVLVHKQTDGAMKQAVRDRFKEIRNLADFAVFLKKMTGCGAWLELSKDPERTYQNNRGEMVPSINRRLFAYKPNPQKADPKIKAIEADTDGTIHYDEDMSGEVDLSDIPF